MSKRLSICVMNQKLESTNRYVEGECKGWEYPCSVKCNKCGNIKKYTTFRSALRGKCPNCNDIKAHRGNQTIDKFNKSIFKYGWVVEGEYNGSNESCSFKCLKCGNIHFVAQAKTIRTAICKNCTPNICLICNKPFIITNKQGNKTTRKFCFNCLPEETTKSKGRYAYNKLYNQYVLNLIKQRYGESCTFCGYNKCYDSLDFHHNSKQEKEYTPARIIKSHKNIEEIFKELDKCILICSNCHRELHYNERNIKNDN